MVCTKVKFDSLPSITRFVSIVENYPYDIDLKMGRSMVDAKSIVGICCMDLSKPLEMRIHTDHCEDLLNRIHSYAVSASFPSTMPPSFITTTQQ